MGTTIDFELWKYILLQGAGILIGAFGVLYGRAERKERKEYLMQLLAIVPRSIEASLSSSAAMDKLTESVNRLLIERRQ